MTEYDTIKIPKSRIKSLMQKLQSKGIEPRGKAEAVNTLINDFLLNNGKKEE